MRRFWRGLLLLIILLAPVALLMAQDAAEAPPPNPAGTHLLDDGELSDEPL